MKQTCTSATLTTTLWRNASTGKICDTPEPARATRIKSTTVRITKLKRTTRLRHQRSCKSLCFQRFGIDSNVLPNLSSIFSPIKRITDNTKNGQAGTSVQGQVPIGAGTRSKRREDCFHCGEVAVQGEVVHSNENRI